MNPGVLPIKIDGEHVFLLDQRKLPDELVYFDATALDDMCFAIKDMVVRGAPSIGVAAGFGLAAEGIRLANEHSQWDDFTAPLERARERIAKTRPTAVNLTWALDRMMDVVASETQRKASVCECGQAMWQLALTLLDEHISTNERLSEFGAELIEPHSNIITHCNAGPLATCGWGTALGVIRHAFFAHKAPAVYVDETRPRNQGSKLTMWELAQDHIPSTLICDSMSGHVMKTKKINLVITGADRIAANGDSANKIGTYNLAVVAAHHGVPFYIAAPLSTFDMTIATGEQIPIEERASYEMTTMFDRSITVNGASAYNPAFDVTPANLIAGIVTEYGVLRAPYKESIAAVMRQHNDRQPEKCIKK